ncbi:hypothetical protein QE394_000853 [Arthrobacter sp. SORGH_AS 212]|nr:hypothetical protein [Arthrobacter sp. SORGH_AS_0212]
MGAATTKVVIINRTHTHGLFQGHSIALSFI